MKQDPEFKRLSYGEQQRAIKSVLDSYLVADPEFKALRPGQRTATYEVIANEWIGQRPELRNFEGELSDVDRAALEGQLGQQTWGVASIPGDQDSYKSALWIGELLRKKDPRANKLAKNWIVRNRAATESLLFQVASGAKEAASMLFGDYEGPDLAFSKEDYGRLSGYLMHHMDESEAQAAQSQAGAVGMLTAFGETAAMTWFGVGTLKDPGLFTKGIWNAVNTKRAAAIGRGTVGAWNVAVPTMVEGVGSGVIDLARSLPEMIETGKIYGPEKQWKRMAQVFGEGVMYDVLFNVLKDAYNVMIGPTARAFRKFKLDDPKTIDNLIAASKTTDPDVMGKAMSDYLGSRIPKDIWDQLDPIEQANFTRVMMKNKVFTDVRALDLNTPQGFATLAKGMGFDIGENIKTGKVEIFGSDGHVIKTVNNRADAVAWFIDRGFQADLPNIDEAMGNASSIKALFGGQRGTRMRVWTRVSENIRSLPDAQLTDLVRSGIGNAHTENITAAVTELARRNGKTGKLTFNVVDEKDFITRAKMGSWGGNEILVPRTFTGDGTRQRFFDYLEPILGSIAPNSPRLSAVSPLSFDAMQAALRRFPNGSLRKIGDEFHARWTNPKGEVVERTYKSLQALNRDVWADLVNVGLVGEQELFEQFYRNTGFSVSKKLVTEAGTATTKDLGGDPTKVYTIWMRDANGKPAIVNQFNDLPSMFSWAPEFELKLPEILLPDMLIRDGKLGLMQTVVTGPLASINKFLGDNFSLKKSFNPEDVIEKTLADGTVAKFMPLRQSAIAVEMPALGIYKEFGSVHEARTWANEAASSFDELEQQAFRKGLRLAPLPNGGFLAHGLDDTAVAFRNVDEFKARLAQLPDVQKMDDFVTVFGNEVDDTVRQSVMASLRDDTWTPPGARPHKMWKGFGGAELEHNFGTAFGAMFQPALSYAEGISKELGRPEIAQVFKATVTGRKMLSAMNYRANKFLTTMFTDSGTKRMLKRSDAKLLGYLMQFEPTEWAKQAKNYMGAAYEMRPEMVRMATAARSMFEYLGREYDLDFLGFFKNYMTHSIDVIGKTGGLAKVMSKKSRQEIIESLMSPRWATSPEIRFLSENARLDELLNVHNDHNVINVLQWYMNKGYRNKYLSPSADRMKKLIDEMRPKETDVEGATNAVVGRLHEYYTELIGGAQDETASIITDFSLALSERLEKGFQHLAKMSGGDATKLGKMFANAAESSVSANWPQKAMNATSSAVLGFKVFRIPANMAQYMNTVAFYGKYAFDAAEQVDHAYIRRMFEKGILNERVFAAASDDLAGLGSKTVSKVIDASMQWQQKTEYMTRALTAKAAELKFMDTLPKLQKGLIDFQGFVDLAGLSYLDPESLTAVRDLLSRGLVEGAVDRVQTEAVRVMMFDYAKENYPHLFHGTLGKLFGKFGVYPVGQIDMYRRIAKGLATPEARPEAIARGLRLIAASTIVYNAFQVAGVDYDGFKLTDPFTFSGGPWFSAMIDFTRMFGEGPDAALARTRSMRNLLPFTIDPKGTVRPNVPRLLVPGAGAVTGFLKGAEAMQSGDYWGAVLDAAGAPRDLTPFQFGYGL